MPVKHFISIAALVAVAATCASSALAQQVIIPTVPVGNAGNAADASGYGSVAYSYNIGTHEVTAGQYATFLNAVAYDDSNNLYNPNMAFPAAGCGITRTGFIGAFVYNVDPATANRPVNWVSFWDATRFANWLHNGQPTGAQDNTTTESGAYTLTAGGISANTVTRNAGWQWAVTSENEWYKAAYYKAGGSNSGYWRYPTASNTAPGNDLTDLFGNNANYFTGSGPYPIDAPYLTTIAGEFQNSASPYGTFDQGGNVFEWNEAIINTLGRGFRGGSFFHDETYLRSDTRFDVGPTLEDTSFGFRVSQVPAPSSAALLGISALLATRRRRA